MHSQSRATPHHYRQRHARAGLGDLRPLHTVDDRLFHRIVDVNLTGTWNGMRAVLGMKPVKA